jgi:hypothetical protein
MTVQEAKEGVKGLTYRAPPCTTQECLGGADAAAGRTHGGVVPRAGLERDGGGEVFSHLACCVLVVCKGLIEAVEN